MLAGSEEPKEGMVEKEPVITSNISKYFTEQELDTF